MNAKIGEQTKLIWETFHQWKDQIESIEKKEEKNETLENIKTFKDLQTQYSRQLKLILDSKEWTPEDQIWFDVYSEIWSKDIQLTDESHLEALEADSKYEKSRQESFTVPFKKIQTKFMRELRRDLLSLDIDRFNDYIQKKAKEKPKSMDGSVRQQAFGTFYDTIKNDIDLKKDIDFEEEEDDELHQMPCPDTEKSKKWANGLSAEEYLETLRDVPKKTLNLAVGSVLLFNEPYFGIWSADKDKQYENDVVNEEEAKKVENDKLFQEYKSAYKSHDKKRYLDFANNAADFEAQKEGQTKEERAKRIESNTELELEMAQDRNSIWQDLLQLANEDIDLSEELKTEQILEQTTALHLLAARFVKLRFISTPRIEIRYAKALYHCAKHKKVIDSFFEIVEKLLAEFSTFFFQDDEWNTVQRGKNKKETKDFEEKHAKQQEIRIKSADTSISNIVNALKERNTKNQYLLHRVLKNTIGNILQKPNSMEDEIQKFVTQIKGDANVLTKNTIFSLTELELISKIPLFEVQKALDEMKGDPQLSNEIWKGIVKEIYLPDSLLEALDFFEKHSSDLKSIKKLEKDLEEGEKLEEELHKELEKWYVLVEALRDHTKLEIEQLDEVRKILEVGPDISFDNLLEARDYAAKIRNNSTLFKQLWPKEYARLKANEKTKLKDAYKSEMGLLREVEEDEKGNVEFVEAPLEEKIKQRKTLKYVDIDAEEADPDETESDEEEDLPDLKENKKEMKLKDKDDDGEAFQNDVEEYFSDRDDSDEERSEEDPSEEEEEEQSDDEVKSKEKEVILVDSDLD